MQKEEVQVTRCVWQHVEVSHECTKRSQMQNYGHTSQPLDPTERLITPTNTCSYALPVVQLSIYTPTEKDCSPRKFRLTYKFVAFSFLIMFYLKRNQLIADHFHYVVTIVQTLNNFMFFFFER